MSRNALEIYNIVCVLDGLSIRIILANSARCQIHMHTLLVHNTSAFLAHANGRLLLHNGCRLLLYSWCNSHCLIKMTQPNCPIWVQSQVTLLEHTLIHTFQITTCRTQIALAGSEPWPKKCDLRDKLCVRGNHDVSALPDSGLMNA